MIGLIAGSTYHVRSYATNSVGTAYGQDITFTTLTDLVVPILTTGITTATSDTAATSGGDITFDGGAPVSSRGVCWSTNPNPTLSNSFTIDGNGTGGFTSSITGLTAGTNYHVRAYAINSAGTAYGQEIIFKTFHEGKISVQILIDNEVVTSGAGILTAYAGNLVRGVKSSGEYVASGKYVFVLHCYSDQPSGESLTFTYEDPISGKVMVATESIPFVPNMTIGSESEPYIMHFFKGLRVQKPLSAGWTWFSVNVAGTDMSTTNVLSSLNPKEGDYIKNQAVSATYYDGTGWFGELAQIDPKDMYMIKLSEKDTLDFTGNPVDINTNQVSIKNGWNWIGYLPQLPKAVADALSSISAVENDYIKDQISSSAYYNGAGWFGEMGNMEPLDGYILKTSHTATLTFGSPSAGAGTLTDSRDGTVYPWVKIGTQTWMAANLAYLPAVSPSAIGSETNPYYYVYGYEGSNVGDAKANTNFGTYGVLYNWPAAMTACPAGWHLSTDAEWKILELNLGLSQADAGVMGWRNTGTVGGELKEAGTIHWLDPNTGGANSIGFTALPGGSRNFDGFFAGIGNGAYFWSSLEYGVYAWYRYLHYLNVGMYRDFHNCRIGFSVRCLKDAITLTITTSEMSAITETSAISGGVVTSDGGAEVTARGVCWSASPEPTIADSRTEDGTGTGPFTSNLTSLKASSTYYLRAYATNSAGTSYGEQKEFTTNQAIVLANVTTIDITSINETTATGGGNVTSDGGASVTAKGICWNTIGTPTILDSKTIDGTGTGTFTSSLGGLTAGTTYYVMAYATNTVGTSYGDQKQFTTTGAGDSFIDNRDGHVYKKVTIGTQTWMAENLAYLPAVSPSATGSETDPYYYVYGYEGGTIASAKGIANYSTYGVLYNWPSALTACPSGWHLPTDAEWTILTDYLGAAAGGKIKESGTNYWSSPNTGATNESGFSARPGGYVEQSNGFSLLGTHAYFWTSTESEPLQTFGRVLYFDYAGIPSFGIIRNLGYSVRCTKN
jgi:uncharacterized protein (TIGR02145 family)